jgi:hypothetical protein
MQDRREALHARRAAGSMPRNGLRRPRATRLVDPVSPAPTRFPDVAADGAPPHSRVVTSPAPARLPRGARCRCSIEGSTNVETRT